MHIVFENIKAILKRNEVKVFIMFIIFTLLLGACRGGDADRIRQEQLVEVKESTTENINEILDDIVERISFLEEEVNQAEGELRSELEESRTTLEEQKRILEKDLGKVEEASIETWNDVIESTSLTIQQVRSATNEISLKVRDLLEE